MVVLVVVEGLASGGCGVELVYNNFAHKGRGRGKWVYSPQCFSLWSTIILPIT
jgi:hypothetical protein